MTPWLEHFQHFLELIHLRRVLEGLLLEMMPLTLKVLIEQLLRLKIALQLLYLVHQLLILLDCDALISCLLLQLLHGFQLGVFHLSDLFLALFNRAKLE